MDSKWPEIERFLVNPMYPGQFEISTKQVNEYTLGLPTDLKKFYVCGDPVECTLECDYGVINVSGSFHRIYIIGIKNQINFTGSDHSIYLEGFHNEVNFLTDVNEGKIFVQGDNPLAYSVVYSNGKINPCEAIMPYKLTFPEDLKEKRRRRLRWQPIRTLNVSTNNQQERANENSMFV